MSQWEGNHLTGFKYVSYSSNAVMKCPSAGISHHPSSKEMNFVLLTYHQTLKDTDGQQNYGHQETPKPFIVNELFSSCLSKKGI